MVKQLTVGKTSTEANPFAENTFEGRNDRWLTPLPLIRALGAFDLDPCGAPGHATANEIWTPEIAGDGLSMPWHGRVWLNPPYGRTMADWMRRLAEHGNGVALIFARTDTALFHELVWPVADAVLFLRGRVTFLDPNGVAASASAGAPSVMVGYGQNNVHALALSGLDGHLVKLGKEDDVGTNQNNQTRVLG